MLGLTRVRNDAFRESRETVIEDDKLGEALEKANAIKIDYFRLRALAVLSLLRLSGECVDHPDLSFKVFPINDPLSFVCITTGRHIVSLDRQNIRKTKSC